eukprot:UN03729
MSDDDEEMYGIDLGEPDGDNDGKVFNKRYFTCENMCGLFVPLKDIARIVTNIKDINADIDSNKKSPRSKKIENMFPEYQITDLGDDDWLYKKRYLRI